MRSSRNNYYFLILNVIKLHQRCSIQLYHCLIIFSPTIKRVGALTNSRLVPDRSGRPPLDTTASTTLGLFAAATKAAAALRAGAKISDIEIPSLTIKLLVIQNLSFEAHRKFVQEEK